MRRTTISQKIAYENYLLKAQNNYFMHIIQELQNQLQKQDTNQMPENLPNTVLFLQNKNTQLNQQLLEKQKLISILIQKYDIPPSSLLSYVSLDTPIQTPTPTDSDSEFDN